jgi:hypothetical protein
MVNWVRESENLEEILSRNYVPMYMPGQPLSFRYKLEYTHAELFDIRCSDFIKEAKIIFLKCSFNELKRCKDFLYAVAGKHGMGSLEKDIDKLYSEGLLREKELPINTPAATATNITPQNSISESVIVWWKENQIAGKVVATLIAVNIVWWTGVILRHIFPILFPF